MYEADAGADEVPGCFRGEYSRALVCTRLTYWRLGVAETRAQEANTEFPNEPPCQVCVDSQLCTHLALRCWQWEQMVSLWIGLWSERIDQSVWGRCWKYRGLRWGIRSFDLRTRVTFFTSWVFSLLGTVADSSCVHHSRACSWAQQMML